jgi:sporulation protein YlmC with PRC-barrel domain
MQGQFMTQMQPQQMMASKLIGTTVVSANNESIGDVNDVIVDRNGQAMAVIIGVGGFLGIGEKDVAVPFKQLEFTTSQQMNQQTSSNSSGTASPATTGSTTSSGTAGTTASGSMAGQQNTASNTSTATTGNTGNSGSSAAANSVANQNADGGVPDRIMLRMTKADLQAAPTFQGSNRNGAGNNSSTNAPTNNTGATGTTAPRP